MLWLAAGLVGLTLATVLGAYLFRGENLISAWSDRTDALPDDGQRVAQKGAHYRRDPLLGTVSPDHQASALTGRRRCNQLRKAAHVGNRCVVDLQHHIRHLEARPLRGAVRRYGTDFSATGPAKSERLRPVRRNVGEFDPQIGDIAGMLAPCGKIAERRSERRIGFAVVAERPSGPAGRRRHLQNSPVLLRAHGCCGSPPAPAAPHPSP